MNLALLQCHTGMSFICADAQSKKIIDILPDRRLHVLVSYFMKYSRKSRLNVKFLVMDMNASYSQLLKTVFPNAEIVTDRFHIIQHINRTFNYLRIKEMNRLKRYDQKEAKQYRRLKRYWKLLLKDYSFFLELCSHVPSELPKEFKVKFKAFNKFSQGVINAFKYSYSNGFLEGINNKIKVIKQCIFLIQNQVFETK